MQDIDNYATTQYDGDAIRAWLIRNVDIAVAVAGLYLVFVFKGPELLERYLFTPLRREKTRNGESGVPAKLNGERRPEQKSFLLKGAWVIWNLLLSVFSLYGTSNVTPNLFRRVGSAGLSNTLCTFDEENFYHGSVGMALGLFCLSKGPELIDTGFLLLSGKKTLPILQWFHHVTTFLYCWHAYAVGSSALQFASSLNYSVHTIMYFYFFLAEAGFKNLVKPFGIYITLIQILQMIVGTALTSILIWQKLESWRDGTSATRDSCPGSSWSIARVQIFIAGVNLILFTDMFLKAYVFKKKKPIAKKLE